MAPHSLVRRNGIVFILMASLLSGCGATAQTEQTTDETVEAATQSQTEQSLQSLDLVNQLMDEVQYLRGKVEILEHEMSKARERERQRYDDMDRRVRIIERQFGAGAAAVESPPADDDSITISIEPVAPDTQDAAAEDGAAPEELIEPLVPVDPEVVRGIYDAAFRSLRQGKYDDSIVQFEVLVTDYPGSELVDDALYWIAEANYVTQRHDEALQAFLRVVEAFPNSQRAPEAMLKIGYIHYDKEDFETARGYLNEVIDKFPASRSAFSARRRLSKMDRDGQF